MRLRSKLSWIIPVLALAYAASPAGAQPNAPQSGNAGRASTGGAVAGSADAQVGFQGRQTLTPAEELTQSDVLIGRMEAAASGVRKQLEKAREQRDVVKTLCLNDKLNQLDVAVRSARDRKTALIAAAGRNDVELSNHEFTILTVLRQRAEQLTAEANQCIGEEAAFSGETETSMTVDTNLPPGDDTQYPPPDGTIIPAPPICASCTL